LPDPFAEFLTHPADQIGFARYDMDGEIPVILWSDLNTGDQAEIGFSTRQVFPDAVTEFFRQTSIAKIDSDELKEINAGLADRIK
jgi:hypothetical protein